MSQQPFNDLQLPLMQDSQIVFDEFLKIKKDSLANPDGRKYKYYTLEVPGPAALILARMNDGRFVLIREYRHPTKQTLLSLPGGYIDPGEDPVEAARRELLEEVGYAAESIKILGKAYPYPGISSQAIYYLLAEGAFYTKPPEREPSELIETVPMHFEKFKELALKGYPIDGNLLTAFSWLQLEEKD